MEQSEALDIVKAYGDTHGHTGTLETMIAMRQASEKGILGARQNAGYAVAFYGFRKLFHGEDA